MQLCRQVLEYQDDVRGKQKHFEALSRGIRSCDQAGIEDGLDYETQATGT